ncbi:MAG: geranylgeranyl reductase family protein [Desulfurococcales archaeon]|nr:geranylgeranyl reductase family protein [Desulfurococcales archaeon]
MEYSYDVLIIGLGPAGSSLAYLLSGSGLSIAGIDMVDWGKVWGKPCGDAIGEHHFDETGIPKPSGKEIKQIVSGILVFSPSEKYYYRVKGSGYIIDRNELGKRLIKEAVNRNANVFLKTRARKPVIENGKLAGVEAVTPSGEKALFKAKIIVDATGNTMSLRLKLPKEWPVNEPLKPVDANIAYREIRELDYEIDEPDYIRIYVNQDVAPGGYWWFFPESKTTANIGLGVQGGRGHPNPMFIFREKLDKREEVGRYNNVYDASGSIVPTRRPANTLVWHNFIGIGDNAFTVNPVHGGGMGYAMFAAYNASIAIKEAFENGDFSAEGLWYTNIGYMKTLGAKQASLDIFRMFLQMMSNDDIEFGLKNRIMREEDMYETSVSGDLKADLSILDKLSIILKTIGRPSLLMKLRTVGRYMSQAKALYHKYPGTPEDLNEWITKVEQLYTNFKSELAINW